MIIIVIKQCQKEIDNFPDKIKRETVDYVRLLAEGELLFPPASKSLSSIEKGLHELRMKDSSGQYRIIYLYRSGSTVYLLMAFKKTTQHIELKIRRTLKERLKQI